MPKRKGSVWVTSRSLMACAAITMMLIGGVTVAEEQQPPPLEPLSIVHDPSSVRPDSDSLTLSVTVTVPNGNEVKEVIAYYKAANNSEFQKVPMSRIAAAMYRVTIQERNIEAYYFEAFDKNDQAANAGGEPDPFPVTQPSAVAASTMSGSPTVSSTASGSSRTWIWWAVGLAAGGAAAYFATQSDSTPSGDRGTVIK